MTNCNIFLASIAFVFLASACGKAGSQTDMAEEQTKTDPGPQDELTEEQLLAMGSKRREAEARESEDQESATEQSDAADDGSPPGGLTKQQYEQTLATMVASGMTNEQAEAMLVMADGGAPVMGDSGMPVAMEQIAAMDPHVKAEEERKAARAQSIKNSAVMVRYDGIDYPLQYTKTPQCADFFGFSSAGFLARTTPDAERGPTLDFGSGFTVDGASGYGFKFWLDFSPENKFDPKYATAHITLLDKDGVIVGYDGHADSGAELNLENSKGLIIEKSRLFYEGPYAADSDKTISIEVIYCPE